MGRAAALLLILTALPGCVIVQVGATNPIPGLTTVAVAPFFNLSQEPEFVADGRQVALAYYAELQKVPGYQVIPVGVVEQAIRENNLQLSQPDDALQLCRILGCDAVVVGAITDYDPYYPPRLGLQVAWYSPYPWTYQFGMPIDPRARKAIREADEEVERNKNRRRAAERRGRHFPRQDDRCDQPESGSAPHCDATQQEKNAATTVLRGQSDDAPSASANRRMSLVWPGSIQPVSGTISSNPLETMNAQDFGPTIAFPSPATADSARGFVVPAQPGDNTAPQIPFGRFPPSGPPPDTVSTGVSESLPAGTVSAPADNPGFTLPAVSPDSNAARRSEARHGPAKSTSPPQPTRKADAALGRVSPQIARTSAGELATPPELFPQAGPAPAMLPDGAALPFDPRQPLMSYTRMFDGADSALAANLRDWLELGGDQRCGSWEAAMHRSDQFIRFCSHQMIIEMLTLHGGDAQRRIVFKFRKYR